MPIHALRVCETTSAHAATGTATTASAASAARAAGLPESDTAAATAARAATHTRVAPTPCPAAVAAATAPTPARTAAASRKSATRGRGAGRTRPSHGEQEHPHGHAGGRHVVAQEAGRPPIQPVVAEEQVLRHHEAREGETAQERRVQDALAVARAGQHLHREVEEGVEQELLGVLVRADRILGERRGEQRPHDEGQERRVERGCGRACARRVTRRATSTPTDRTRSSLAREDRDGNRGREGGEERELGPLEVQGGAALRRAYSSIVASSTSITGMSSWTG